MENITLPSPKQVIVRAAETKQISQLEIDRMVDHPKQKKVVVHLKDYPSHIILWEGDAYDAIGQWTDENVKNRLLEIFAAL